MGTKVTRADLAQLSGMSPKLLQALSDLFVDVVAAQATADSAGEAASGAVASTGAIQSATVLTLSPNAAFDNERVLVLNPFYFTVIDSGPNGQLIVSLRSQVQTDGGFECILTLTDDTDVTLPTSGRIPSSADGPYADDAAAAAAGVAVGEWYAKTGGTVAWRVA